MNRIYKVSPLFFMLLVLLFSSCQKYPDHVRILPSDAILTFKVNGNASRSLLSEKDLHKILYTLQNVIHRTSSPAESFPDTLLKHLIFNNEEAGINVYEPFYCSLNKNRNVLLAFRIQNYRNFEKEISSKYRFVEENGIKFLNAPLMAMAYNKETFAIYVDPGQSAADARHTYLMERFNAGKQDCIIKMPGFKEMFRSDQDMNLLINGNFYDDKEGLLKNKLARLPVKIEQKDFNMLVSISFSKDKVSIDGDLFVKNAVTQKAIEMLASRFTGISCKYFPYVSDKSVIMTTFNFNGKDYKRLFPQSNWNGMEKLLDQMEGELTLALNIDREMPIFLPSAYDLTLHCDLNDKDGFLAELDKMGLEKGPDGSYKYVFHDMPFINIFLKTYNEALFAGSKKELVLKKKQMFPMSSDNYRNLLGVVRINYEQLLNNPIVIVAAQKKFGLDITPYNSLLKNVEFKIRSVTHFESDFNMGKVGDKNYIEFFMDLL